MSEFLPLFTEMKAWKKKNVILPSHSIQPLFIMDRLVFSILCPSSAEAQSKDMNCSAISSLKDSVCSTIFLIDTVIPKMKLRKQQILEKKLYVTRIYCTPSYISAAAQLTVHDKYRRVKETPATVILFSIPFPRLLRQH